MSKLIKATSLALLFALSATHFAAASPLVFRPINPSFGGDPLNGNWLLAYGQGQRKGANDNPGFTIDFPDFGNVGQDGLTDPELLPPADPQTPQQ
jgi:hypothetical protein